MHELEPHFRAQLTYYTEEQGGRSTPVGDGHRTILVFDASEAETPIEHQFLDRELAHAGDIIEADISMVRPENIEIQIYAGLGFTFFEGEAERGSGVVLKVL